MGPVMSLIFVEVLPEDLGKEIKPDKSLIYAKGLRFEDIGGDQIADKEVDKFPPVWLGNKYIGIDHHWDGQPWDVGRALVKRFNSYEEALNLMTYGSVYTITGSRIIPKMLLGGVYNFTEDMLPFMYDNLLEGISDIQCAEYTYPYSYVYLYANGEWMYAKGRPSKKTGKYNWKPLIKRN